MLNYSYYSTVYFGEKVKDEKKFNRLYIKAEAIVDKYTFGRSNFVSTEYLIRKVNMTICQLVDTLANQEDLGNLTSETNAEWGVSYSNDTTSKNNEIKRVVYDNLLSTNLLYRGV